MKIRNGFVSNSSSSSFMAIISPSGFEALQKNLSDIEQLIVKKFCKKIMLEGKALYLYDKASGECVDYDSDFIEDHKSEILKAHKCEDEICVLSEHFMGDVDSLQSKIKKLGKDLAHCQSDYR